MTLHPQRPIILRLRYRERGGHVHCRLFAAPVDSPMPTWELCGTVVFRVNEWASVRAQLEPTVSIREED